MFNLEPLSLRVGTWQRNTHCGSSRPTCLAAVYSEEQHAFIWTISYANILYRILISRNIIRSIDCTPVRGHAGVFGLIRISLRQAPVGHVHLGHGSLLNCHGQSARAGWAPCTDFSQDRQLSNVLQHDLYISNPGEVFAYLHSRFAEYLETLPLDNETQPPYESTVYSSSNESIAFPLSPAASNECLITPANHRTNDTTNESHHLYTTNSNMRTEGNQRPIDLPYPISLSPKIANTHALTSTHLILPFEGKKDSNSKDTSRFNNLEPWSTFPSQGSNMMPSQDQSLASLGFIDDNPDNFSNDAGHPYSEPREQHVDYYGQSIGANDGAVRTQRSSCKGNVGIGATTPQFPSAYQPSMVNNHDPFDALLDHSLQTGSRLNNSY